MQPIEIVDSPWRQVGCLELRQGSTRRRHVIVVEGGGQAIERLAGGGWIERASRDIGIAMRRRTERADAFEDHGGAVFDDRQETGQIRLSFASRVLERLRRV